MKKTFVENFIFCAMHTCLFGHFCQKFSFRVLLSFCLFFCQFQPGVPKKSVAYKKKAFIWIENIAFKFTTPVSFPLITQKR